MANTNLINRSITKSLPIFPELVVGKTRRVFTKHFTNLSLWCTTDEVAIINWLSYQCKGDNTFEYKTRLLDAYKMSCLLAGIEYCEGIHLEQNISKLRRIILDLIEKGLLLHTPIKSILMINPMLTYQADLISKKEYEAFMKFYQKVSADKAIDITIYFTKLVAEFLESKKSNYKYRQ